MVFGHSFRSRGRGDGRRIQAGREVRADDRNLPGALFELYSYGSGLKAVHGEDGPFVFYHHSHTSSDVGRARIVKGLGRAMEKELGTGLVKGSFNYR